MIINYMNVVKCFASIFYCLAEAFTSGDIDVLLTHLSFDSSTTKNVCIVHISDTCHNAFCCGFLFLRQIYFWAFIVSYLQCIKR